jgi:hypothetical protein
MSLDFRVTKIKDHEKNYPDRRIDSWTHDGKPTQVKEWNLITQQIVFGCLSTGIGELKENNVAEWWARYKMWCRVRGLGDPTISYKDVVQHIGLHTNVFPEETRTRWLKSIAAGTLDEFKRNAEYDRSHNNDIYNGVKKVKV